MGIDFIWVSLMFECLMIIWVVKVGSWMLVLCDVVIVIVFMLLLVLIIDDVVVVIVSVNVSFFICVFF